MKTIGAASGAANSLAPRPVDGDEPDRSREAALLVSARKSRWKVRVLTSARLLRHVGPIVVAGENGLTHRESALRTCMAWALKRRLPDGHAAACRWHSPHVARFAPLASSRIAGIFRQRDASLGYRFHGRSYMLTLSFTL